MSVGLGEVFSLLSALGWAGGVILYKRLGETLPPMTLNLVKNLLVLGLMVPTVLLLQAGSFSQLTSTHVIIALVSGLIGIGIADTLYFKALNLLGAGRMGIVGNLYSPFVIIFSFLFLAERLSPLQLVGFALVLAGVLTITIPGRLRILSRSSEQPDPPLMDEMQRLAGRQLRIGVLIGAFAVLLMAVAIVMVKRTLEEQPFFWIVTLRLVGGVLGMLVLVPMMRRSGELATLRNPALSWPTLIGAAFLGQYLAMMFWLAGYRLTSASVASVLNETASVFIVLLAWLILGEPLTRRKLLGIVLSMCGVALILIPG